MALIEVDDVLPRIAYTATAGQTIFAVPFVFFSNADLKVYVNDVLKTLDPDYAVAGSGASEPSSRKVTFAAGLSVNDSVVIVRDIAIERAANFPVAGPFSIPALNTQLAKVFAILQQSEMLIARTLRLADSDTTENLDIPAAAERASKFLGFDADGDPMVSTAVQGTPVSPFMTTVLDDADADAARNTLGVAAGAQLTSYTGLSNWLAQSEGYGPFGIRPRSKPKSPFQPGGYLTLVSGTPVITSDQASKTVVYYTQDAHNRLPHLSNGRFAIIEFDEPRLVLSSAHEANGIYDVFAVARDNKGHIVTGPKWGTVTAGSGARGDQLELVRNCGYLVNRYGLPGMNNDGATSIGQQEGLYLGSIYIDGSAGQVTCHRSFGQSRKWGVWNAYNRRPLYLKAGDGTASWTYGTASIRASNNDASNSLTVLCGLAEESIDLAFEQTIHGDPNGDGTGNTTTQIGIGWNSTTSMSGRRGKVGVIRTTGTGENWQPRGNGVARFLQAPALGINVATALEVGGGVATTQFGGEDDMVLSAHWRG